MARNAKLSKAMKMIVVATGIVLGGTSLSTAALARGGGGGGGHFGGGGTLGAAATLVEATCSAASTAVMSVANCAMVSTPTALRHTFVAIPTAPVIWAAISCVIEAGLLQLGEDSGGCAIRGRKGPSYWTEWSCRQRP